MKEIDPAVLAAVRKVLEEEHHKLALLLHGEEEPPPAKVGKPIVRAMQKISAAITLLGGE